MLSRDRRNARDGHDRESEGRTVKCPSPCVPSCLRGNFPGQCWTESIVSGESFSAKTVWLGNPAGSIAPVGRAALGISTLSHFKWKFGSLEVWFCWWGVAPRPDLSSLEKATRRETEGGGRGQRRSRRATDGARSGSRPLLRLCGSPFPRTLLGKRLAHRKGVRDYAIVLRKAFRGRYDYGYFVDGQHSPRGRSVEGGRGARRI